MTYRQAYAKLYGEARAETVHNGSCPDTFTALDPDFSFECRSDDAARTIDNPPCCGACWDQEIPAEIAAKIQAAHPDEFPIPDDGSKPDAEISVTVRGEDVHVHVDGDIANVVTAMLGVVNAAGQHIYSSAKDLASAEKLIHTIQKSLAPTSAIWDFSEGGGKNAES